MNNGVSPKTNNRILRSETIDTMFTNSIPGLPWRLPTPAKPHLVNPVADSMFPREDEGRGWGLTFMLLNVDGKTETWRGRNFATWSGLPNMYYWMDREMGVAGMLASQCMPMGDLEVLMALDACERAVYQS